LVLDFLGKWHHCGAVTLQEFLAEASLDRHQFAARINVSPEAVRRYLKGERIPDKSVMSRIAFATEGKVTANDFFGMAA
jgi:transcriptional regulator with XRE-family HTH domain